MFDEFYGFSQIPSKHLNNKQPSFCCWAFREILSAESLHQILVSGNLIQSSNTFSWLHEKWTIRRIGQREKSKNVHVNRFSVILFRGT